MSNHNSTLNLEDFFRTPEQSHYQISPDNQTLSLMQPWAQGNRRLNIFIHPIQDPTQLTQLTFVDSRDIAAYMWLDNNTLIYAADTDGDENTKLYSLDIHSQKIRNLTPYDEVKAGLIDELEHDPEHILISLNHRDKRLHDVYRLHIASGDIHMIAENPGHISQWMCDHNGQLRIAISTDGVNQSLLYRPSSDSDWQTLVTTHFKDSLQPLCFSADNQQLYVSSNRERDTSAIYTFNLETAQEDTLIFEHLDVDVVSLHIARSTKIPYAVSYTTDRCYFHFLDPKVQNIHQQLQQRLPGMELRLQWSRDDSQLIVRSFSDQSLGDYYHYDIHSENLTHLCQMAPWLDQAPLRPMQAISYQARDGLMIHGYLTTPQGSGPFPVVINPHGGPWARDAWGFNSETQCLAYHGYAVMQINFRGSTGYGRNFWQKGFKQWGKAMQDDITDGVHWLIEQGIADSKRIAIYGASYGGYATLAGLTFTPELYACGIDYVGVSSIFTLIDSFPPYWELYRQMFYEMVGHPEHDKAQLEATSPLYHVDHIRVPLLIAQGAQDPRVKKAESDQMVAAMREKNIPVDYLVKDNEGHGFGNEENRFEFYHRMLAFLQQHLA